MRKPIKTSQPTLSKSCIARKVKRSSAVERMSWGICNRSVDMFSGYHIGKPYLLINTLNMLVIRMVWSSLKSVGTF
jgi:hypothetical protein